MKTDRFVKVMLVIIAGLLLASTLSAQTVNGKIFGTVTDPNGSVVSGAKVVVKHEKGLERETITDIDGNFTLSELPPGYYDVTVSHEDFLTDTRFLVLRTSYGVTERRIDFLLHKPLSNITLLLLSALLIPIWGFPIIKGIKIAKRKGYSPHWMWFGFHPLFAWIAFLFLCLAPDRYALYEQEKREEKLREEYKQSICKHEWEAWAFSSSTDDEERYGSTCRKCYAQK